MTITDEQIEKAAKAVARLFSQKTWLCECTAQRGDDCDREANIHIAPLRGSFRPGGQP